MQIHLRSSRYWRGKPLYRGKFMSPLQVEIYALILGRKGEWSELFLCLWFSQMRSAQHNPYAKVAFFFNLFILFMAVLGLRFCARAFSSCGKRGPLFIAVRGPLTIAASLVAEHRLQTRRLSNCGSRAYLLRGMWDLPRPGLKPVSPALAGRLNHCATREAHQSGIFCGGMFWSLSTRIKKIK